MIMNEEFERIWKDSVSLEGVKWEKHVRTAEPGCIGTED
jgi:hypothetical protein